MNLQPTADCAKKLLRGELKMIEDDEGGMYVAHCALELVIPDGKQILSAEIRHRDGTVLFKSDTNLTDRDGVIFPRVAVQLDLFRSDGLPLE